MFEKELIIDGKGHLLGRLASVVAKELLNGQKVTVVRCEELLKSGSLFRNDLKRQDFKAKTRNANPRRAHIHYCSPSRLFWRTLRGMLPHKTSRGTAALNRLKVFEGIPYPYDHKRRMVIPDALKILRMQDHRKFCQLGQLASQGGWRRKEVVDHLESERKAKAAKWYEMKKKKVDAQTKANANKDLAKVKEELAKYGF